MNIVFRVDASLNIGTGHVMRCLTMAHTLAERGAVCHFICREHAGHLLEFIKSQGFAANAISLSAVDARDRSADAPTADMYVDWLGGHWREDAEATSAILGGKAVDWLIVDHYAIDYQWEQAMRSNCAHLMVIDDLANRSHDCDLLLDQNLGRGVVDYIDLVRKECTVMAGPRYALLRPEFRDIRQYSLARRQEPELRRLLITMGGVDKDNATGQILDALKKSILPKACRILVVMGPSAPWLHQVRTAAAELGREVDVIVNAQDMARLMADSDLAIGAAGSTSWERCCLGLPTLMAVLADNQREAARSLQEFEAALLLDLGLDIDKQLDTYLRDFTQTPDLLARISHAASLVCDGAGSARVLETLLEFR